VLVLEEAVGRSVLVLEEVGRIVLVLEEVGRIVLVLEEAVGRIVLVVVFASVAKEFVCSSCICQVQRDS